MICTLSKHEAEQQGYTDSLMLDHEGNVAEATGANIFFKDKNGEIHTPIPDSFLDGITRRTVIEIAKSKGIKVNERKITPEELSNFVGCFLTGTAAEVTPVSCIAENQFKVCETIIDLNESYQALVRKKKQLNFYYLQILHDQFLFLNIHNLYIKLKMLKAKVRIIPIV